jgi:hypothetical protein
MWTIRLLWCLCSYVPVFLFAQVDTAWVRRYDGPNSSNDQANALAIDNAGNLYTTGRSYGITGSDYATIKYLPNGDTAWVRRYNGIYGYDAPADIAVDGSGNVYVTGSSEVSYGNKDYATIKYYPNGDTAWVRHFSWTSTTDEVATALAVDDSGRVYVTGWTNPIGWPNCSYLTIKCHPNGDIAWSRTYAEGSYPYYCANALAIDDSGYVYVTGGGSGDYVTIKYRPDGDTAWVRRYNGAGNSGDEANAIAVDDSGYVYVTGEAYISGGGEDYATIKYCPNGDTAWVRTYNSPADDIDEALAMAVDGARNVYVTGYGWGIGGDEDWITIKYYPDGDTAWVRSFGGTASGGDISYALAVDNSGSVYVTGYSIDSITADDYTTIKYNADGNQVWLMTYDGSGSDDEASAIAIDGSGSVYVTGASYGSSTGQDFATIKYVQPVIFLSTNTLGFGGVTVGQSAIMPFVIYNLGEGVLRISDIDNNLPVYAHNWDPLDSLVLPGDSLEVMVTFTPDDTVAFNDTCWIDNNDSLCCVTLAGQGLPPGIAEGIVSVPREFALRQALPNPCKSVARLQFELPKASVVDLSVYDVSGRLVSRLIDGICEAGIHTAILDASGLSAGVYFCRLKAGEHSAIRKVIITN